MNDYTGEEDPKQTRKIELFQLTSPHREADLDEEKIEPYVNDELTFTEEFAIPVEKIEIEPD